MTSRGYHCFHQLQGVLMNEREYDHDDAIRKARIIVSGRYIVLDTETTGLKMPECCQLGWVIETGEGGSQLCRPSKRIEPGAENVHHISNAMVANEKTFPEIWNELSNLSIGRTVVFYNSSFDIDVIRRSLRKPYDPDPTYDAMLIYSAFRGEWNDYFGNYKWHKLIAALNACKIPIDETLHDASADAAMTRKLLIHISQQPMVGE